MCARLSRLFRAQDNRANRKRDGLKVPLLPTEDASDTDAFLEQHWVLCAVTPPIVTAQLANPDLTHEPLDIDEVQFIHALIDTEKFMRLSVKLLDVLRAIEPDTRYFTPIPDTALCWVSKAVDLAITFRHCLYPNSASYRHIAQQSLRLTPALDKFLQLLSAVRASRRIWNKQAPDLWTWPQHECFDPPAETGSCCLYTDLVVTLEEVQQLLARQDASRDRLGRSNFSKARKVVAQAFARSSKVLVIRIDLTFREGVFQNAPVAAHETATAKSPPDISQVRTCFTAFIRHVTKVFGHARLGYIDKLEYGAKKGFHHHFILLLSGHKHQQDINIAKQLGEHWANVITAGQGLYLNCNANKERYKHNGIGMIDRSDSEKREIFETKVVQYLVKYDLPFQLLKNGRFRQFSTSCCT